jgi:type II secretory ATPase GspE/PulE/Tfp pilus assembly ATPase PilB-like protein
VGCPECDSSGYSGRRAVFELLVMDSGLRAAMEAPDATITSIQEYLNTNPPDSSLAGRTMQLVLSGETSWEEFERININI